MAKVNPYLTFNGNCEEAFLFYKSIFGGEFTQIARFKDVPAEMGVRADYGEKIMNMMFPLSNETMLLGSDAHPDYGVPAIGQNISLSVSVSGKEEADKVFHGLSAGGNVTMPIADVFWGSYFGMLIDKYGITWMVSTDHPNTGA